MVSIYTEGETMTESSVTLSPTAADRDLWFLGTLVRLRATGAETDGTLAMFEQVAPKGFSPPLHVHRREDTALHVLDGEVTVLVGDVRHELGPGGFVWLPRHVPHTFRVESDMYRQLEVVTPAGFEQFHVDAGEPALAHEQPASRRRRLSL